MMRLGKVLLRTILFIDAVIKVIGHKIDLFVTRWYRLVILLIWVGASLVFYWTEIDVKFPITSYRVEDYSIQSSAFTGDPNKEIVLKERVCSTKDIEVNASYQFVDHIIYTLPSTMFHIRKGCHTFYINFEIPGGVAPDIYRLEATLTGAVNPVRRLSKLYNLLILRINPTAPYYQIVVPDPKNKGGTVLVPSDNMFNDMYRQQQVDKSTTKAILENKVK